MQEHPELPSVEDALASDANVYLDDLGELTVPAYVVAQTAAKIRGDLVDVWPEARADEIDDAVRAFTAFYRQTLQTGVINYGDARELGSRVASELRTSRISRTSAISG